MTQLVNSTPPSILSYVNLVLITALTIWNILCSSRHGRRLHHLEHRVDGIYSTVVSTVARFAKHPTHVDCERVDPTDS